MILEARDLSIFSNLSQVVSQEPQSSRGYHVFSIGNVLAQDALREPLKRGEYQRQIFKKVQKGVVKMVDTTDQVYGTHQELRDSRGVFELSPFENTCSLPDENNPEWKKLCGLYRSSLFGTDTALPSDPLEQAMELYISSLELHANEEHPYVVALGHHQSVRKNLGVPEPGLHPGSQLMKMIDHFPGIQSEYFYLTRSITVATTHIEDGELESANMNYEGSSKLWLMMNRTSALAFETAIVEYLRTGAPICSQFVRHGNWIFRPSLLRHLGIKFTIVRQKAGDLITVDPGTYHFVINEGPSFAGAINFSSNNWNIGPFYKGCTKRCMGPDSPPITRESLRIPKNAKPRELDLDSEAWDSEELSDSKDQEDDEEPSNESLSKLQKVQGDNKSNDEIASDSKIEIRRGDDSHEEKRNKSPLSKVSIIIISTSYTCLIRRTASDVRFAQTRRSF